MILRPFSVREMERVASWFAEEDVRQWLDFDSNVQTLHATSVRSLVYNESHLCRLFTSDMNDIPIGVVGFSNINRNFHSARLWYILGQREFCGRGYTSRAVSKMLTFGFSHLGLRSVNAWTVERNIASLRVLQRNNFRLIGRQRQAHVIDGRAVDRLLFDLLTTEHWDA